MCTGGWIEGEIYEVAVTKCGDEIKLGSAITRGDVNKSGGMYFFKKYVVGSQQTWGSKENMSRQQERTALEFSQYAASVDSIVDSNLAPTDVALNDMFALLNNTSTAGPVVEKTMDDMIEAVTKKKNRLAGAVKLAENMVEKLGKYTLYPPVPDRASQSVAEMLKQCENAEIDMSKVSFMLKFKKDHGGNPLTEMMSNKANKDMDVLADKIIEEIKVVRAVAAFALK